MLLLIAPVSPFGGSVSPGGNIAECQKTRAEEYVMTFIPAEV